METGHKVSAVVHGGLILWVMLFDLFSVPDDAIAPAVTEVSLISAAELAALSAPIAPPLVPITPPPPPPPPPPTPAPPPPQPIQPPPPVVAPPPPARPQAAVISNDPSPVDAALNAVQQQVDRVAPQAVAPSDLPEGRVDQAAIAPDPTAPPAEAQPAQEATARPAAATEIVTEATRISEDEPARRTATAPEVSLRPRARPAPTPVAQPTPPAPTAPAPAEPARPAPAESQTDATAEAVARALEEALSAGLSSALAEASGFESGPMSQGEIDRLRLAIEDCWNVGILSTDALQVVVTIGFEMTPDARPIASSIRQIQTTGGNPMAQLAAFDAGRRAIEECGINGYGLPVELFEQWRSVEIVFNPARMRTR